MIQNKHETIPSAGQPGEGKRLSAGLTRALHQVTSEQLLGKQGELVILHGGRQYRLRITQNGKLILTA